MGIENISDENARREVLTHFAPAERADEAQVQEQSRFVESSPLFLALLEAVDGYLMILNPERQVLAMNQQLLKDLGCESPECLLGSRPGEVLNCIHAADGPGGCGTSKVCSTCGAVITILASQRENKPSEGECLATVRRGDAAESLELSVRATPVEVGGHRFTVMTVHDISGDKRRQTLERTFFHDILNTIGGLMGWSSLLQNMEGLDPREVAGRIVSLSKRLQQEIEDQRRLTQAERGALELDAQTTSVSEILETIRSIFEVHPVASDKSLDIAEPDPEEQITTDPSLLARVLTNMTKNAFEAIVEGETVSLRHARRGDAHLFSVKNPGAMPEEVALQIFKRSFSTKGQKGRGIGTYSMKLFGERCLGGKVGFDTDEQDGTTFWIELPGDESDSGAA